MDTISKLLLLISYLNLTVLAQSKVNYKDSFYRPSPSSGVKGFGQRISSSASSYSLPIYNLGSTPSNLQADCSGEALFGMYADLNSGCASYHVCHGGRRDTFTCPDGTLFNQELMTCDYWYRVSCGSNGPDYSQPPQQQPQPQPPSSQGYYPSWSPQQPSLGPLPSQPQIPTDYVPLTGSYNPSQGPFPVFPQLPQSPSYPPIQPQPQPLPPSVHPTTAPTDTERERPETEHEEPRTIRPPTSGYNPFDPPSASPSGPNLPIPIAPNSQYPQYPSYQPQSPGYPQLPGPYSPQSPPSGPPPPPSQQPPYSFGDWNQDEPEWTYAWMKRLDSPTTTDQQSKTINNKNNIPGDNNNNQLPSGPYTGQPFDFSLVNQQLGGSAAIKERSDSPNPWLFSITDNNNNGNNQFIKV